MPLGINTPIGRFTGSLYPKLKPRRAGSSAERRAPGFRYAYSGALLSVGLSGYNWSSTISSVNGMHLGLSVPWLVPSGTNGRGYGFQLCCLSE